MYRCFYYFDASFLSILSEFLGLSLNFSHHFYVIPIGEYNNMHIAHSTHLVTNGTRSENLHGSWP